MTMVILCRRSQKKHCTPKQCFALLDPGDRSCRRINDHEKSSCVHIGNVTDSFLRGAISAGRSAPNAPCHIVQQADAATAVQKVPSDESTYKELKYSPEPSCMEYSLGRKSSFARRYSIVEKLRVPESLRIASESHCRSVAR